MTKATDLPLKKWWPVNRYSFATPSIPFSRQRNLNACSLPKRYRNLVTFFQTKNKYLTGVDNTTAHQRSFSGTDLLFIRYPKYVADFSSPILVMNQRRNFVAPLNEKSTPDSLLQNILQYNLLHLFHNSSIIFFSSPSPSSAAQIF